MLPKRSLFTALAVALAGFASLHAATITFNNRAAFDAAAGATTLIDFESLNPGGYAQWYNTSLTVGDVTFTESAGRLFVISDAPYSTSVGSNFLNNNSGSNLVNVSFANPVYSVGMDVGYIWSWGGGASITLNLSNGDSYNVALQQLVGGGSLAFWGAVSDVAITGIAINDFTQGLAIDDFSYSRAPGNNVPDSGATALLLVGTLLTFAGLRRRR